MATAKSGFRYPRELASLVHKHIFSYMAVHHTDTFLGGSFIRELPKIGDIDIVVLTDNIAKTQDDLNVLNGTWLRRGVTSSINYNIPLGILSELHLTVATVQVDLWITDQPGNWGAYCMFCAGDQKLNIIQRANASKQGYLLGFSLRKLIGKTLDKKGNLVNQYDDPIYLDSERAVYDHLRWPWIEYKNRSLLQK